MAKRKAKSDVIVVHNVKDFLEQMDKLSRHFKEDTLPFKINQATVKDGFCHYQYTILHGVGAGDTHSVKGSGIVDKSLYEAFAALRVHLAIIDDAFNYSGIEIGDLSDVRAHSLTDNYTAIPGAKDGPRYSAIGNSMAVPVMRWLGQRIQLMDKILKQL